MTASEKLNRPAVSTRCCPWRKRGGPSASATAALAAGASPFGRGYARAAPRRGRVRWCGGRLPPPCCPADAPVSSLTLARPSRRCKGPAPGRRRSPDRTGWPGWCAAGTRCRCGFRRSDPIFELQPTQEKSAERRPQSIRAPGRWRSTSVPCAASTRRRQAAPGALQRLAKPGQQVERMESLGRAELVMRSAKGDRLAHSASAPDFERIASRISAARSGERPGRRPRCYGYRRCEQPGWPSRTACPTGPRVTSICWTRTNGSDGVGVETASRARCAQPARQWHSRATVDPVGRDEDGGERDHADQQRQHGRGKACPPAPCGRAPARQ